MRLRRGLRRSDRTDLPARHASRILIADDLEDYRALLRVVLSDGKFEIVGEACDGREAVDLTSAEQPDAIVLDLHMPTLDGLAAISLIRERSPGTKILVLSGFDETWMAERAISAGADRYIQKGGEARRITSELTDLCS